MPPIFAGIEIDQRSRTVRIRALLGYRSGGELARVLITGEGRVVQCRDYGLAGGRVKSFGGIFSLLDTNEPLSLQGLVLVVACTVPPKRSTA